MNILNKIRIKIKEKQYKKYIEEHRKNVKRAFIEMTECRELDYIFMDDYMYWALLGRIENHDMSKYSKEEFDAYRKNFFPINQKEKKKIKMHLRKLGNIIGKIMITIGKIDSII